MFLQLLLIALFFTKDNERITNAVEEKLFYCNSWTEVTYCLVVVTDSSWVVLFYICFWKYSNTFLYLNLTYCMLTAWGGNSELGDDQLHCLLTQDSFSPYSLMVCLFTLCGDWFWKWEHTLFKLQTPLATLWG